MKSLRGKLRSIMFLGFNSFLSQQAAGNLTQERLKYEDFLTKRTVSHYNFSSELNHASDIDENQRQPAGSMRIVPGRGRGHLCWWPLINQTQYMRIGIETDAPHSKSYGKI